MARIFLSHQYTLEDKSVLVPTLTKIVNALQASGHSVFCSALQQEEITENKCYSYDERLSYCIKQQQNADLVLAILLSHNPSNGMLQELKQAKELQQKYVLVATPSHTFEEYRAQATEVLEYEIVESLVEHITKKLSDFDVSSKKKIFNHADEYEVQ